MSEPLPDYAAAAYFDANPDVAEYYRANVAPAGEMTAAEFVAAHYAGFGKNEGRINPYEVAAPATVAIAAGNGGGEYPVTSDPGPADPIDRGAITDDHPIYTATGGGNLPPIGTTGGGGGGNNNGSNKSLWFIALAVAAYVLINEK